MSGSEPGSSALLLPVPRTAAHGVPRAGSASLTVGRMFPNLSAPGHTWSEVSALATRLWWEDGRRWRYRHGVVALLTGGRDSWSPLSVGSEQRTALLSGG